MTTIGPGPPDELISAHSCPTPLIADFGHVDKFPGLQKLNGPIEAGEILPKKKAYRIMKTLIRNMSTGPLRSETHARLWQAQLLCGSRGKTFRKWTDAADEVSDARSVLEVRNLTERRSFSRYFFSILEPSRSCPSLSFRMPHPMALIRPLSKNHPIGELHLSTD